MGGTFCNCSTPSKNEDALLQEAKTKQNTSTRRSNESEDCNEIPVKQNKKIELKNGTNMSLIKLPLDHEDHNIMSYNLAGSSSHNINFLIDQEAANRDEEESDDDESISALSDGFNADGEVIEFNDTSKEQGKDKSHKSIFRYKSKKSWDHSSLDTQEKEMLAEMRRLSVSTPQVK
eukprot:218935_1